MKNKFYWLSLLFIMFSSLVQANKRIVVSTCNTQMIFSVNEKDELKYDYYGLRLSDINDIFNAKINHDVEAFKGYGLRSNDGVVAIRATHGDGNSSVVLKYISHSTKEVDGNICITTIKLKDENYPFYVDLILKSFVQEDVIELNTEIFHEEKKNVMLYDYASAYISVLADEYYLSHFHGTWGNECILSEERLLPGTKTIENHSGSRPSQMDNPSFLLTLNEAPSETKGEVIAGTLAYTGEYALNFKNINNRLHIIAGIKCNANEYKLKKEQKFITPQLILTYSQKGKGQASRNLHRYARKYKILGGDKERKILLNSWEGVYFNFKEEDIVNMIDDIAEIGGELFVLDDGWFGNKYERNGGYQGLGDWETSKRKLPHGINFLINEAEKQGVKFGIWVEPEMVNTKSELYEKHPDWIAKVERREIQKGRGGTQVILDLSNPQVQNFIFQMLDNLLKKHPGLNYVKWDANADIVNSGSSYLSKDKQSHLSIEYNIGLTNVLKRFRAKYPHIVIQACASGGGRVSYGFLPYFHEVWVSDNTDALKRIYIQWGTSHMFPAIVMASHVSANKNHQTGRELPLKFRFDVAMTGRLGMELQPKNMSENEKMFSKEAIKTYKKIRPIIQFGDLFRLISPFEDKHVSSLMYVDEDKSKAVFFAYHLALNNAKNSPHQPFKMDGLNPDQNYLVTEINKAQNVNKSKKRKGFMGSGNVYSGKFLMNVGINLNMRREYDSIVLELVKQ